MNTRILAAQMGEYRRETCLGEYRRESCLGE